MKSQAESKIDDYFSSDPNLNKKRAFIQTAVDRLKSDTSDSEAMEALYRSGIERNIIGLLLIQGINESDLNSYLHNLSTTALEVEVLATKSAATYLRESSLANKIIYMEAARKFTPEQIDQYITAGSLEVVREKKPSQLTTEDKETILREINEFFAKFKVDDELIRYFLPVYSDMITDNSYNANAEYTQAERISSSLVFNLVSLPMNERCQQLGVDPTIPSRVQKAIQLSEGNGDSIRTYAPNYVDFINHLANELATLHAHQVQQQEPEVPAVSKAPRAIFDDKTPLSPIVNRTPKEHLHAVIHSLQTLMGDNSKLRMPVMLALVDQIQELYKEIDIKMRKDEISESDGEELLNNLKQVALKLAATPVNTEKEDNSQNLKTMHESRPSLFSNRRASRIITPEPPPQNAEYLAKLTTAVKDIEAKLIEIKREDKRMERFI